jgi:hypothetical protein
MTDRISIEKLLDFFEDEEEVYRRGLFLANIADKLYPSRILVPRRAYEKAD